ncbi:MAG: hypothetical protein AAGG01_13555 [Planctomycetota bacterium]
MRPSTVLILAFSVALPSCVSAGFDPGASASGVPLAADTAFEIDALASELAERAEARTPLGGARIQVGKLDAIQPRRSPYRQVSLLERDLRATEATIRHELGMALGNRVNLVGDGADLATHAIEGEFLRTADALELSLRLVEIESDWIVATARRRIDDFVPEFYDRRLQPVAGSGSVEALPRTDSDTSLRARSALEEPDAEGPRTRALRPAYPSGAGAPVIVKTPAPEEVLAVEEEVPSDALDRDAEVPVPDGAIEFEEGPAAARLRAIRGGAPSIPPAASSGSAGKEQQLD